MSVDISFIAGMAVGIEYVDLAREGGEGTYVVLDLVILRIVIPINVPE